MTYNETAVEELVSQMVDLGPALVLLEATGGLELPLVAALAAAALPVVVVVNPARFETSPGPRGRWPRPTLWTQRFWPTLPKRSTSRASFARSQGPGPQLPGWPKASDADHAGLREEPPGNRQRRRPSPH